MNMEDVELLEKIQDEEFKTTCQVLAGLLSDNRITYFEIKHDKLDKGEFRWQALLSLLPGLDYRGMSADSLMSAVNVGLGKMRSYLGEERSQMKTDPQMEPIRSLLTLDRIRGMVTESKLSSDDLKDVTDFLIDLGNEVRVLHWVFTHRRDIGRLQKMLRKERKEEKKCAGPLKVQKRIAVWLWDWQAQWTETQLGLCLPAATYENLSEPEKKQLQKEAAELMTIIEEVTDGIY